MRYSARYPTPFYSSLPGQLFEDDMTVFLPAPWMMGQTLTFIEICYRMSQKWTQSAESLYCSSKDLG